MTQIIIYTVTSHGSDGHGKPGPAALDQFYNLDDALGHACQLLSTNVPNVAIQDDNGHSISGNDLMACCNGDKNLTPDLQAVKN